LKAKVIFLNYGGTHNLSWEAWRFAQLEQAYFGTFYVQDCLAEGAI
jgi:hypothetical protein